MSSNRSNDVVGDLDSSVEEPEPVSSIDLHHGYQRLPVDVGADSDSDYEGEDIENRVQNINGNPPEYNQSEANAGVAVTMADIILKRLEAEYEATIRNDEKVGSIRNQMLAVSSASTNRGQAEAVNILEESKIDSHGFKSEVEIHEETEAENESEIENSDNQRMSALSSAQVQQVAATFASLNLPPAPWEGKNAVPAAAGDEDDWDKKVKMILGKQNNKSNYDN
mmetsp:Transcript_9907/g.12345  ORF Transcript_9907/g.12345 Transcript_9907/m.12345 type:complete len:224 (-) Transcript_9907:1135-1806(-)